MRLIINADDFGLTPGVSKGIIKAMKEGVVSDTSMIVNSPYFKESTILAKEQGLLQLGIHLSLTTYNPILPPNEIPTLVDLDGKFHKDISYILDNSFSMDEVEKELRGQINKFLSSGLKLNHISGHHQFYGYNEDIHNILISLAHEFNVPLRSVNDDLRIKIYQNNVKTTNYFSTSFHNEGVTSENLLRILEDFREEKLTLEIMTHPAIVDDELNSISHYNLMRSRELELLTSYRIKEYIKNASNIELISFSEL